MSELSASAPQPASSTAPAAWTVAVRLLVRWIERHERADQLLDSLPKALPKTERARVQHLLFGALRHMKRIDDHVARLVPRPPRTRLRAVLLVAGYELIESQAEGQAALIVHHAVEQAKTLASPAEARLVNAVVRKLVVALQSEPVPGKLASAEVLASYFSHPVWLVQRWLAQWGAGPTRALLELHQHPATVFARWRDRTSLPPPWLPPAAVAGFVEVPSGHWHEVEPLIEQGKLHLHDPATRLPVQLLAPQPGESILDLCAAPGGKSLLIADTMGEGQLVSFDLPGARIDRLKENLARIQSVTAALVQGDLLQGPAKTLRAHRLPTEYPGVLIDVPCSNTGVMRHRVDVKWRLQEGDFAKHARQQLALLQAAARLVAPGGRLVYSTCSLDAEENEQVVAAFLERSQGKFTREAEEFSRSWETGHDGAAAFRLRRVE